MDIFTYSKKPVNEEGDVMTRNLDAVKQKIIEIYTVKAA